jgi:hypothetical protein
MLWIGILFLAATGIGLSQTPAPISPSDEAALVSVWKLHLDATNDHSRAIGACQEFRKRPTVGSLGLVADGLAAWHYLAINDATAATNLLEKMLNQSTDPLGKAGTAMAKRWLTRLDREKVRLALKHIYRAAIEFPPSLDAMKTLTPEKRGPATDRWGQTWSYRLTEFKSPKLKDLRGQRYELQSAMLGADSDFAKAMERPYAGKINLKPGKLIGTSPGRETVEFTTTDQNPQKAVLSVGSDASGLSFPFLGSAILILSDGDHWAVLPRPR